MGYKKKYKRMFVGITAICVLLLVVCAAFAGATNRQQPVRFEYKVLQHAHITEQTFAKMKERSQGAPSERGSIENLYAETFEAILNQLGDDGWELASSTEGYYILKRVSK